MTVQQSLAEREMLFRGNPGDFWTLDRVARALEQPLGQAPAGTLSFSGISTDTRSIRSGQIFVALVGENHDGHDHLAAAAAAEAGAFVVSDARRSRGLGVPTFAVRDTLVALGMLGSFHREAWGQGRLVVGVTGTNGKTSTKDMIAAALGSRMEVNATVGNLNNRIGVPLTLLTLSRSADAAVIEMGTNLPGEIETLRQLVRPQIAVVTSVGEGHLEGLGSVEGVLDEKSAIFAGASVAVVPAGQPEIGERASRTASTVRSAGLGVGDLAASRWGLTESGSGWLEVDGQRVDIPLRGTHNLRNAMLALAVAREAGVSIADAADGIAAMSAQTMRMQATVIRDSEEATSVLINDAYNANPASVMAAVEYLAAFRPNTQRVIVLGGMRELGDSSAALHERAAGAVLDAGFDVVAAVGDFAAAFRRVAANPQVLVLADDVDDLWPLLRPRLSHPATILLKASRGVRLERIVPHIQEWASN